MKMLKKMAALLLAGVMAMALLTACGDDSTQPVFWYSRLRMQLCLHSVLKASTGIQVNDADLKKLAESKIDLIDTDEDGTCCILRRSYSAEEAQ